MLFRSGHEVVYLHAERNLATSVESCETHSVGVDQRIAVGKDRRITVGGDELKKVTGDQHLHVVGASFTTIDSAREIHVRGIDVSLSDTHYITTKNEFVVSAGYIMLQADDEICLKVGNNSIVITKAGVAVVGLPLISLNPSGAEPVPYLLPTMPNDAIDP